MSLHQRISRIRQNTHTLKKTFPYIFLVSSSLHSEPFSAFSFRPELSCAEIPLDDRGPTETSPKLRQTLKEVADPAPQLETPRITEGERDDGGAYASPATKQIKLVCMQILQLSIYHSFTTL